MTASAWTLSQSTQDANYTFGSFDPGATVLHTSATPHAWTIPPAPAANADTGVLPRAGSAITVRNTGTGVVTLTRGAGVVLRIAGLATDQNVTLAQWGLATLYSEATNVWVVSGTGIS